VVKPAGVRVVAALPGDVTLLWLAQSVPALDTGLPASAGHTGRAAFRHLHSCHARQRHRPLSQFVTGSQALNI
ncbi:MAG TPA: hypothetical protein ACQGQI_05060, partial [Xylella sp.]